MTARAIPSLLLALVGLSAGYAHCETPGQIRLDSPPGPATSSPTASARVFIPDKSDNQFVVAIYYRKVDGNTYICSGTLLTARVVLTAGHCGCGVSGSYSVTRDQNARQPREVFAVDGVPVLFDQRVCRNGLLTEGNDLALVRLQKAVQPEFDERISQWPGFGFPPELVFDLRASIVKGSRLTVVGYGYTGSGVIGFRNQGEVSVFSFDCEERRLAKFCDPFTEMILADQAAASPPNDTCGGDSGGPVFWTNGGTARLVAVTSRAAPGVRQNATLHCGGGGIYTLIGRKNVHDWLAANGVGAIGDVRMMTNEIAQQQCKREKPPGGFPNCVANKMKKVPSE
jgi:secreted trypsin-like serine protease